MAYSLQVNITSNNAQFKQSMAETATLSKSIGSIITGIGSSATSMGHTFTGVFQRLHSSIFSLKSALIGLVGGFALTSMIKEFISAGAQMEKMQGQIKAVYGGLDLLAADTMKRLTSFARETGTSTQEIVQSFIMLRSQGMQMSEEVTKVIGSVAAVRNKGFLEVAQALMMQNPRYLRQLGADVTRTGEQAIVTVNGVSLAVAKTRQAIFEGLVQLFGKEYPDALEKAKTQSERTMDRMKSIWHDFMEGVGGRINSFLTPRIQSFIDLWKSLEKSGAIQDLEDVFSDLTKDLLKGISDVIERTVLWASENRKLIKTGLYEFAKSVKDALSALKAPLEFVVGLLGKAISFYTQLPPEIRATGLVFAILFGPLKAAAVTYLLSLIPGAASAIENLLKKIGLSIPKDVNAPAGTTTETAPTTTETAPTTAPNVSRTAPNQTKEEGGWFNLTKWPTLGAFLGGNVGAGFGTGWGIGSEINKMIDSIRSFNERFPTKVPYENLIQEASVRYNVDPDLIKAVIKTESDFNPRARSNKGARGLMQIGMATAKDYGLLGLDSELFDPEKNIDVGVQYLAKLLGLYSGNVIKTLAAYNAGPETVKKYGGVPPYKETQQHIVRTLGAYDYFTTQQTKSAVAEAAVSARKYAATIGTNTAPAATGGRIGNWPSLNDEIALELEKMMDEYKAKQRELSDATNTSAQILEKFKEGMGDTVAATEAAARAAALYGEESEALKDQLMAEHQIEKTLKQFRESHPGFPKIEQEMAKQMREEYEKQAAAKKLLSRVTAESTFKRDMAFENEQLAIELKSMTSITEEQRIQIRYEQMLLDLKKQGKEGQVPDAIIRARAAAQVTGETAKALTDTLPNAFRIADESGRIFGLGFDTLGAKISAVQERIRAFINQAKEVPAELKQQLSDLTGFQQLRDGALQIFDSISSGMNSTLQGIMQGTQTWGEGMRNLMRNIGLSIVNTINQVLLNRLRDSFKSWLDETINNYLKSSATAGATAGTDLGDILQDIESPRKEVEGMLREQANIPDETETTLTGGWNGSGTVTQAAELLIEAGLQLKEAAAALSAAAGGGGGAGTMATDKLDEGVEKLDDVEGGVGDFFGTIGERFMKGFGIIKNLASQGFTWIFESLKSIFSGGSSGGVPGWLRYLQLGVSFIGGMSGALGSSSSGGATPGLSGGGGTTTGGAPNADLGLIATARGGIVPSWSNLYPLPVGGFSAGGIVDRPMIGFVGENAPGRKEAVVPLPDNRSIPVTFTGMNNKKETPAPRVNVQINGDITPRQEGMTPDQVVKVWIENYSNGGETRSVMRNDPSLRIR